MSDNMFGWISHHEEAIFLAFLIIAPTVAILLKQGAAAAGVLAAVGAAALLFTRLPDISSFALFGLTAKLEHQSQQVQVTLAQLQNLGSVMGQILIESDAARERLGSAPSPAEHEALKERIVGLLKSIDLPDKELSKVATSDRKWVIVDYVIGILQSGASRVPDNKKAEWSNVYAQYTQGGVDEYATLTPERLEEIFSKFGILDDHEKSLIDDYRYYLKTGTLRHP
jgi:hypothetical protein